MLVFATVLTVSPVLGEGTDFRRSRGDSGLWCATIRSRDCFRREIVLVMQSANDRFGADGVRVLSAMTRTGLSEIGNRWWWIRNAGTQPVVFNNANPVAPVRWYEVAQW